MTTHLYVSIVFINMINVIFSFRGQTPSESELAYLNRAKLLELYGVDMHMVLVSLIHYTISKGLFCCFDIETRALQALVLSSLDLKDFTQMSHIHLRNKLRLNIVTLFSCLRSTNSDSCQDTQSSSII